MFESLLVLEKGRPDSELSLEDIETLLCDDESVFEEKQRTSIIGFPSRPLYRDLSFKLFSWMTSKNCPINDLPSYDLLDEQSYVNNRKMTINTVTPMLQGLVSLWSNWNTEEKIYRLRQILQTIGRRGLLDLLGLRKTVGTVDVWPPSRRLLENSFIAKHSEGKSELTVGARALAKHSHRDETESWWGICTGTEAAKNEHAFRILQKILDDAHWINIH